MYYSAFLKKLKQRSFEQVCMIVRDDLSSEDLMSSSTMDPSVLDQRTKIERFESQSWEALKANPVYELALKYKCNFPEEVPSELPIDRGIKHEIDLVPGTKYCVTRQWPLPREQVDAIDKFFESRKHAGHVR
jgi:hypothetical protein